MSKRCVNFWKAEDPTAGLKEEIKSWPLIKWKTSYAKGCSSRCRSFEDREFEGHEEGDTKRRVIIFPDETHTPLIVYIYRHHAVEDN